MSGSQSHRKAEVSRETRETRVLVELDLEGEGGIEVSTGIGFFDHMLSTFAYHARFGLRVRASGDVHVDQHHLVEDVGIALGQAFRDALGADLRIRRFGHAYVPLDDALARAVADLSGRPFLHYAVSVSRPNVGGLDSDLVKEFFRSFVANAAINLHLDLVRGENSHHEVEAVFKAAAIALRDAARRDTELPEPPSTKGKLAENSPRGGTKS